MKVKIFQKNEEENMDKIVKLLSQKTYGLTIKEISSDLEISRITASKYLSVLEVLGKITLREVGKAKLHYLKGYLSKSKK
jgi:response regulator of citrate/malate metabolism